MADQTVKIENLDPSKSSVAYEMAKDLWMAEYREFPKMSQSDDFLRLVDKCVRSLNTPLTLPKK